MSTILDYLEKTAMLYPNKEAVNDGNRCLSWMELKQLSQKIAGTLSRHTEPGSPVPVLMEKSVYTLAVMLGTVYAGCFYVPVSPGLPGGRIGQILGTTKAKTVVTSEEHLQILQEAGYSGKALLEKTLMSKDADMEKLTAIRNEMSEKTLLYCIFTSGSTGTPKGIIVSHGAVIRFISHFTELFTITSEDRLANQAPFDFDVSVKDIYSAVMTGAALVLVSRELFSTPPRLLDYLCDMQITTMIWASSALCLISMMKGLEYRVPEHVKKVMFSGEVMPAKQLRKWQEALPKAMFVNLYGPTEITCNCTYYVIDRKFQDEEKIPIGKAFPGRNVFLLNGKGEEITSRGESGEICVAGESISEGYYHNQEETQKRFGFYGSADSRERMYRTGDVGVFGEDGNLYFAGRTDFQIKHMGHRIELEEIERSMMSVEGVEKSCCVFDKANNRIIGFFVGNQESIQIRRAMKRKLPVYMIPAKLIRVDEIPLTKNGKMDRSCLLERMVK